MRPTLFYLPYELMGVTVFGFGWALLFLMIGIIGYLFLTQKNQPISKSFSELGFIWMAAAAVIVFLLPRIETHFDDGTPNGWTVGLPVRGYGVMLMLGVVSAVAIAMIRCKEANMSQDAFFSLATWVVVAGLLGARIFYVVQKWTELEGTTIMEKLVTALKVTEGGLVVYGSVIGGLIAILAWTRKYRFPLMPIADAVTPAFFIGLAFGRIGCLLNGCCYGGTCEQALPSIEFPAGSPAYMDQLRSGKLLGMVTDKEPSAEAPERIRRILPGSWAAVNAVTVGQTLSSVNEVMVAGVSREAPMASPVFEAVVRVNGDRKIVPAADVPIRALAVHPSQVYAAISGLLLCAWTLLLSSICKRYGVVFSSGIIGYGVLRIIEEIIRVDEAGQFGTALSIAQWISLALILFGTVLLVLRTRLPFMVLKQT